MAAAQPQPQFFGDAYAGRILARDGYRCRWCKRPARTVFVCRRLPALWFDWDCHRWRDGRGQLTKHYFDRLSSIKVRVHLRVVPLNYDDRDLRPENLVSLCEHCCGVHARSSAAKRAARLRLFRRGQTQLSLFMEGIR